LDRYVFDASALLVYFGFQPRHAGPTVARLLDSASEGKSKHLMSSANWGEIYYIIWRERGRKSAEEALHAIDNLPVEVVDADRKITKLAAALKATLGMGYADSFAAALAQNSAAMLVAADRDFDKVKDFIPVLQLL
jgi:predicted nucleic acid-binding protein